MGKRWRVWPGGTTTGRNSILATMLFAALLGGCGDQPATGWSSVTDTVGSVIRVTHMPGVETGPTLVADEELRIGTLAGEGPESFGFVRSIAVLDDGRFAVADALDEEVRLFDREGRHLRTFGGPGQGPGELLGMQGVFLDHEGMLRVAEQENGRLSVFHPDSGFVRSFPLQLFSYGGRGPWQAAIDSTGRTMVLSSGRYGEGRYWNMLRVYDAAMRQLDSIPYYDYTDDIRRTEDPPGTWRITMGTATMHVPVPHFAQPQQVVGPTGEIWSTPEGATRFEVSRWMPPGDTSLIIRSLRPPVPLTPAERDAAIVEVRSRLADRVSGAPSLDPAKIPATRPPSHGLSLDDRGRLWVRITDEDALTTLYDVFEPDGRHAETLALPFRVDLWIPPVVRHEKIWVVVRDESDVQYVVRARMRAVTEPDSR